VQKEFFAPLFSTFCLGSGTEAYWGEAKRYTFWPQLSPEAIDLVICLGCFETGTIYTAFCFGSVRTEAIGDKYFFFKMASPLARRVQRRSPSVNVPIRRYRSSITRRHLHPLLVSSTSWSIIKSDSLQIGRSS